MGFKIAKFMDEGSSNPAVARLSLGLTDILPFTTLSEEKRKEVFACGFEVMQLVVRAQKTAEELLSELRSLEAQLGAEGIKEQPGAIEVPSAMGLHRAATFVVQAKKALQATTKVFELVWGQKFPPGHFHKVSAWARADLGSEHPLTEMLADDQKWIAHLIDLRNEEEHPKSGKPFATNYDVTKKEDGKFLVTRPKLFDGTDVRSCLTTYSEDLLTFTEEVFILALSERLRPEVVLVEIPEPQRRPDCPLRFAVALKALVSTASEP